MSTKFKWLGLAFVVILITGCERRYKQYEMEGYASHELGGMLMTYDALENPRATNLAQVYSVLKQDYPHILHQRFERYESKAGFKKSIFEKYIFLPAGITNPWIRGEVVMMNATPFTDHKGTRERGVFSKIGSQYTWRVLSEEKVQELFRTAGIIEPKVVAMPAPPPTPRGQDLRNPFSIEISNALLGLGRGLGFSPEGAVLFRHAVFLGLGLCLPLVAFWLWRRSRR